MDYTELFVTRNLLFETGRNQSFKNIVFVSHEDKQYLKMLGRGMFNGFDKSLMNEITDLKKTSYLCKSLQQESQFQLEEYKEFFMRSKNDLISEKFDNGMIVEGTVEEKYCRGAGSPYKALLQHENVLLYFPVLESWTRYILPKMENETFETREIIKCVSIPVSKWKGRRKLLTQLYNHSLVEKVNHV
jgi:hypothetical protein